jgi:8-amino-7-oxononanoate synthase
MTSLDEFCRRKLTQLDLAKTRRSLIETDRTDGIHATRNGQSLISFCCNDYLNLTQHPAVKQAAIEATARYGAGAGASRLVTGNHPLFRGLEDRLAALKGTEAAIVFGSGYLANLSIIPALAGPDDLVLIDALGHACLFGGTSLSGARKAVFRHNDLAHLEELLARERGRHRHCLILTDHVFSMDGDLAPITPMAVLARRYDAWLMTDDAHGIGILPPSRPEDVPLQMGTLSKALGSYGGYLAASRSVVDLLYSRARAFIYTTGLPPASVAAATAALDLIAADPAWAASPLAKARQFAALLDLPEPQSQIVPIIIGAADAALAASDRLRAAGYLVAAIRPPTVPSGTARLRFTFTAGHSDEQIAALAEAVRPLMRDIAP